MDVRIQKIMSLRGYCSRRKAEEYIAKGRVKVNGAVVHLGDKAREADIITVDNIPIAKLKKKYYVLLNKPVGTLCSSVGKHKVTDLVPIAMRLYSVGRLDVNTSGALILTNDGDFANRVMHPRYDVKKTYKVKINLPLAKKEEGKLQRGLYFDEGKTEAITPVFHNKERTEFSITIHEGRKRIVRDIMQYLGYEVLSLHRSHIGSIDIKGLEVGKWRMLKDEEVKALVKDK